jgi:tRNA (guanine37-N1)-methyltransferase
MNKDSLKKLLQAYLDIEKLKLVPRGFDLIGHVAILEIPDELKKEKRMIAKALMEVNKNIQTVLEKTSGRKGKLRLREYKFLAGKKRYETTHREYGAQFKINPAKVYFSPRELTERQRIAEQVNPSEVVMVMFSGACPYPIAIAKRQPKVKSIIAIELNKIAHKYAVDNVRINKVGDKIIPVLGDARKKSEKWFGKCDRVVMPLPLGAEDFLDVAVKCLRKKGGVIHFYNWGDEDNLFGNATRMVRENMRKMKKRYKILNMRKVLPYSPKKWKVCIDFKVS